MNEGGEGSVVNMYAQLDSQEMAIPKDLSDYWQDPSSYFLIPGLLLKETIEDLEWTAIGSNNSTVEVLMQRQLRRLSFTAQAAGSLQIDFPVGGWEASAVQKQKCASATNTRIYALRCLISPRRMPQESTARSALMRKG
ncbi:TPA: hypothetical protein ACH3X3_012910 [Trebouxia sp. C0006]